ncbi:hypothetical protein C8T65DRAFT_750798 [Cerioporus squamosus]|nr:hypothetical protein C8T65DRAFT_750798 [Cerioporus squamosus]
MTWESKRRKLYEHAALRPSCHPRTCIRESPSPFHDKMYRPKPTTTQPHMNPARTKTVPHNAHTLARPPSAYHLSRGRPHPIVRIPNKLLVKILAAANPGTGSGAASWSPYWLPLMAVCRHWRDLIRSTPDFWQKIAVGRRPQWLELCLRRSPCSLLQISFRYPISFDAMMKVLRPHWHRIEYLSFKELDCAQFNSSVMVPPMPELRTLTVNVKHAGHSIRDGSKHDGTGLIFRLPHGTVPRLKALHLEGMSLVGDHVALSSLRFLHLGEYAGARPLFTTAQFLTMLNSCTSLERLTIADNALDAIVPSPSDDAGPVAQLPGCAT